MKVKHIKDIILNFISLKWVSAIISSIGYYNHEHITWRRKIHKGKKLRVHSSASIRNAQNIYIGNNSHINHNCCIWCGENSKIIFGDNLLMGPGVKIFSTNHGTKIDQIMTFQDSVEGDVIVGNDCWIGANSVILKGVSIADGCIIAAGSVVTKSLVEPHSIYAGIPAKKISVRK